jgi:hypothetical protein
MATPKQIRRRGRWSLILGTVVAFGALAVSGAVADGIAGDVDAVATSAPAGNGLDASQTIGSPATYDYSAFVKETGNTTNDVFAASGDTVSASVAITQNDLGWPASVDTQFTGGNAFTAYLQNKAGMLSVTVPNTTSAGAVNHIKVTITATASNGQTMSPDSVVLNYNITATAPSNSAPVIDSLGAFSGNEGSDIGLTATAHDPDGDPLTYSWGTVSTTGGDSGISCPITDADNTDAAASVNCNDDSNAGTFALTLSVSDDHSHTTSQGTTLDVDNVAPVASANATPFAYNHYTGVATAKFDFADAGTNDTHTPSFTWSAGTPAAASDTETLGAGTATDTATFAPGCYTLTVTGKTADDEPLDSNVLTIADGFQVDIYSVRFLPPIVDNQRNFAKYGNVLPVKVQITSSCTGLPITSDSLYLSYVKGTGDAISGTDTVAESVSSADGTGGQMRVADGFYIYNFTTKPLTCNTDYTLRVWVGGNGTNNGGTELLDAVLSLKK